LTAADVSVKVDEQDLQPSALLGPGDDLLLLVVTDLTGDLALSEVAKKAFNEQMDRLPPNAAVGLLRAQDGMKVLVDPTADRPSVKAAVAAMQVTGKAGLLDTVVAASQLGDRIMAKASVRVAVLFITDSDVGNYREDFTNPTINWSDSGDISRRFSDGLIRDKVSKLEKALAATETPAFILSTVYLTSALNRAYQAGLTTLAGATGGEAWFCRSRSEIPDSMGKAFDAVLSHYSLTVPVPDSAHREISVTLGIPGRAINWRSRYTLPGE
jgi:hypothetical protein